MVGWDLEAVRREVYRRFPELAGVEPSLREREGGLWAVTFRATLPAEGGFPLARIVTATVDAQGSIVKISESKG